MSGGDEKKKMSASDFVKKIKSEREQQFGFDYRRAALDILPHICGRCSREFEGGNLSQLTVHHKDGDHDNNPRDGRNWELLCHYCHEDEHSREVLAGRIASDDLSNEGRVVSNDGDINLSLGDKLKAALEGNKK